MRVDTPPRPGDTMPAAAPVRRSGSGRWILITFLLLLAVGLLVVLLLGRFVAGFNPFNRATVDRSEPAVLLALQDLSEYHAATGEFQVIVDAADEVENLPLQIAGQRTLFVASGTVDAAVDLSGLDADAVTVDEARRRVAIALPAPALTEARVDPDRSYVFERQRGLLDRVAGIFSDNPTSEQELYQLAEVKLTAAAAQSGLEDLAQQNTEAMLRTLLGSLGFSDVDVTFE